MIQEVCIQGDKELMKETSIRGYSIFLKLPHNSVHFPRSLLYGTMHTVPLGVVEVLFKLLHGKEAFDWREYIGPWVQRHKPLQEDRYNEPEVDVHNHPFEEPPANIVLEQGGDRIPDPDWEPPVYVLSSKMWETIGEELAQSVSTVPEQLSRAMKNISTHHSVYRAATWTSWLLLYIVPVLTERIPKEYISNIVDLVKGYELLLQYEHTSESLEKLQFQYGRFVREFERLYMWHGNYIDPHRIKVMTSNVHSLLHVGDQIEDLGPTFTFWENAGERYVGMIEKMIRSKVRLSQSLMNEVAVEELLKIARLARPNLGLNFDRSDEEDNKGLHQCDFRYLLPKISIVTLGGMENRHLRGVLNGHFTLLNKIQNYIHRLPDETI